MFFTTFQSIYRTLLVGLVTFVSLVIILRVTGKRTLSKLNVFDFIITIALGSTVATIVLSSDITLAEGITAILLLTLLQYFITYLSVRWPWWRRLITDQPTMLYHQNQFLTESMQRVRISHSEILQAIRNQGYGSLRQVEAVVLETNGDMSIITQLSGAKSQSTLKDVVS